MIKNVLLIALSVGLGISLVFTFYLFVRLRSHEEVNSTKEFFYENEDDLYYFAELCIENEISSIRGNEATRTSAPISTKIEQYYVYSYKVLADETVFQLDEYLDTFDKYVSIVFCNSDCLSMGFGRVDLHYSRIPLSIEKIKKDYFYDEVRFLDSNWYIGVGDSLL